ncbi:MAG TPA: UvrD-helicase domain-containing protein [bacterium]|nr:UvrD-helicase domain-containing protein [bacterium]
MNRSLLMTASAGAGKTYQLTKVVRGLIAGDPALIVAITFTRAAAAEMEKRILDKIAGEDAPPVERLHLLMRAAQVRYSTIDALFHQFLATEDRVPQMADDHEKDLIKALADERFFTRPEVIAATEEILIAARILKITPERLTCELDNNRDTLAAWECPKGLLDELKATQARTDAAYEKLREEVAALEVEKRGNLYSQVIVPLLVPLRDQKLGAALFLKHDIAAVKVSAADQKLAAYAKLRALYPPMRRLIAEHVINTARLRTALLKRFSALRADSLEIEKQRLDRRYFEDVPRELIAMDGPDSPDRPELAARLYERGYHRTAHLLLDEFQDTSAMQMELLRPLLEDIAGDIGENGAGVRSLFFVGDWKQSIYRWRGADPERLKRWLEPLRRSGQLPTEKLPYNWRSTPLLIGFFNELTKELFAGNESAGDTQDAPPEEERREPYTGLSSVAVIPVSCGRGDGELYERLVAEIRRRREETGCSWGDITVLCRSHAHLAKVAKGLAAAGEGEEPVGTSDLTGRELLSLREGAALYLALAAIFSGGKEFVERALPELGQSDLTDTVRRLIAEAARWPAPHRFSALAGALRELAPRFPRTIVETLWDEAERYFDRPDAGDAGEFLRYLLAVGNLVTVPEGEHSDRVKLATMHSAKGLEFPHVFVLWKDTNDRNGPVTDPDDGCPLDLNKAALEFLATGPIPGAARIAGTAEEHRDMNAAETANLLYVAATRAKRSLTIVVRANKEGVLTGFGEKMRRAAQQPLPGFERTDLGHRHDHGKAGPMDADHEDLPLVTGGLVATVPDEGDIDPALRSADIEAGIARGLRIHAALGGLSPRLEMPTHADLTPEERKALATFLRDPAVREMISRSGTVLCEQHLSDRNTFGVVDRLIIAPDRITLIDYKTGRVGHLAGKYREQMARYRAMLVGLYPGRPVEAYLLFVDDPKRRVVAV